ncbi:MAG: hypothetical protein KC561_06700, partial [Myxococcales bacterium]|nr:hypothetical protein [Myxococcales bacterium]
MAQSAQRPHSQFSRSATNERVPVPQANEPAAAAAAEAITEFRLGQADGLVRSGQAQVRDELLVLSLGSIGTLEISLPPALYALTMRFEQADVTPALRDVEWVQPITELLGGELGGAVGPTPDGAGIAYEPSAASIRSGFCMFRAYMEHLCDTLALESIADPAALFVEFTQRVGLCRDRAQQLTVLFPDHVLARTARGDLFHILGFVPSVGADVDPRSILLVKDAELLSPGFGRGVYVALRLPQVHDENRDHLTAAFADLLEKRYGGAWRSSEATEVLGDWSDFGGTILLEADYDRDVAFGVAALRLHAIWDFLRGFYSLLAQGIDPFELLPFEVEPPKVEVEEAPASIGVGWAMELQNRQAAKPTPTAAST